MKYERFLKRILTVSLNDEVAEVTREVSIAMNDGDYAYAKELMALVRECAHRLIPKPQ